MRKAQKQEVLEFLKSLYQAHKEISEAMRQKNYDLAKNMLGECQEFALSLGESIEKIEGEGHATVLCIEKYCEMLFHIFEDVGKKQIDEHKVSKILKKQLVKLENSVKNDISAKIEAAFFPYKASMWDSLESIYLAASEDPECDAYCVPIPYYDLNPDRSLGQMHYEGNEYPENIEVTDWKTYCFEERKPDMIFIHNPYDNCNFVTSIHPRYYSGNLKQYTDQLVYVPYYITSGGMSEGQSLCPAYVHADYIVIQSPLLRRYFDERIPGKKFLPFGSPKVDRVIRKCQNPPEPPEEWKDMMVGRKVYFYNTSIGGALANTDNFLKKMTYVFQCFEGREAACLLWRPHPLLASTFRSMRPQYWETFEALRRRYVEKKIGILDTSADIENSIALSDVYIGDAGTSVTALFGVAGKPIFILDNRIHSERGEDNWKERIAVIFNPYVTEKENRYAFVQGNKLYVSEPYQYNYHFFCDLTEYGRGGCYSHIYEIGGKRYICPTTAHNILVAGEHGVEKKIELEKTVEKTGTFSGACKYGKYLFLMSSGDPAIVRLDTVSDEVKYFNEGRDVFIREIKGQDVIGGFYPYQGVLYLASPADNMVCKLYIESGEMQVLELPIKSRCGCNCMIGYKDELWLMPYNGKTIVRWNPYTNEIREYTGFPQDLTCIHPQHGYECEQTPYLMPVFCGEYAYFSPCLANMYMRLNIETGEFIKWQPPFQCGEKELYSPFICASEETENVEFRVYSVTKHKIYSINMETFAWEETEVRFDKEEVKKHELGFSECSEKLKYACIESRFNSLENFLDGKIVGNQFDKDRQLAAYKEIIANNEGNCGEKIYKFIKGA